MKTFWVTLGPGLLVLALLIGLLIYLNYGRKHSKVQASVKKG
jgi:hypothetical protein